MASEQDRHKAVENAVKAVASGDPFVSRASNKRIEGEFHYAELIDGGHWRIARKPDDKPVERVIREHTAEDAVRHYDEQANHFRKQALVEVGEAVESTRQRLPSVTCDDCGWNTSANPCESCYRLRKARLRAEAILYDFTENRFGGVKRGMEQLVEALGPKGNRHAK